MIALTLFLAAAAPVAEPTEWEIYCPPATVPGGADGQPLCQARSKIIPNFKFTRTDSGMTIKMVMSCISPDDRTKKMDNPELAVPLAPGASQAAIQQTFVTTATAMYDQANTFCQRGYRPRVFDQTTLSAAIDAVFVRKSAR